MVIDRDYIYHGAANTDSHDGNPVRTVQDAYNQAATKAQADGRNPVRVEVYIFVEKRDA